MASLFSTSLRFSTAIVIATAAVVVACQSTPCARLMPPTILGASVTNFTATERRPTDNAAYCDVQVYLSHPDGNDNVRIAIWLPLTGWNGRFQGFGGGGFVAGSLELSAQIAQGYSAGSTDAGLTATANQSVPWRDSPQLLTNFAYLSVHEMTLVGKMMTHQFYGRPARYSYWNGCSTGGRQGYMEAQRYPTDYDGIYGASPAINWGRFQIAELWPYLVQNVEGEFVPQCVFSALTKAAIATCDLLDGGADGLINDPPRCVFDANRQVGQPTDCSGNPTITSRQALIWNKIRVGPFDTQGRRIWYGIVPGAPYSAIADGVPSTLAKALASSVENDPNWDPRSLTYENFPTLFAKSHELYSPIIATDDLDLSSFRDAGGKLLSWHGWADQLIFPNGTVDYRLCVEDAMGGAAKVDEFYRLYMAPGVQHCGGGDGAAPTDPLGALTRWVENGTAPDTIFAAGPNGLSRNLCRFPRVLRYKGSGDLKAAESWICVSE